MDTDSAVRAVVAFPLLDADDRQWIEAVRAKHDPEAKRIPAHFTLVFPAVLPLRATEAHVSRVAALTEPIRFNGSSDHAGDLWTSTRVCPAQESRGKRSWP